MAFKTLAGRAPDQDEMTREHPGKTDMCSRHLTVCRHLDLLKLGESATIGRANWITGFPTDNNSHFAHVEGRRAELLLSAHAAITHRHLIDATSSIIIGAFTTVAGFRSQLLTHSIDLYEARQHSAPITVGRYCFVGTSCVLLGGSFLPDNSVLGANSLLNKHFAEPHRLYAGVPATALKELPETAAYFTRATGFVS